ncbi:hypothetical protein DFH09DRAFT_1430820 [Mycena vulgaris]|nr:hypothetical protein DFH09DRAFT_1430820 [Mycena vulgaris]
MKRAEGQGSAGSRTVSNGPATMAPSAGGKGFFNRPTLTGLKLFESENKDAINVAANNKATAAHSRRPIEFFQPCKKAMWTALSEEDREEYRMRAAELQNNIAIHQDGFTSSIWYDMDEFVKSGQYGMMAMTLMYGFLDPEGRLIRGRFSVHTDKSQPCFEETTAEGDSEVYRAWTGYTEQTLAQAVETGTDVEIPLDAEGIPIFSANRQYDNRSQRLWSWSLRSTFARCGCTAVLRTLRLASQRLVPNTTRNTSSSLFPWTPLILAPDSTAARRWTYRTTFGGLYDESPFVFHAHAENDPVETNTPPAPQGDKDEDGGATPPKWHSAPQSDKGDDGAVTPKTDGPPAPQGDKGDDGAVIPPKESVARKGRNPGKGGAKRKGEDQDDVEVTSKKKGRKGADTAATDNDGEGSKGTGSKKRGRPANEKDQDGQPAPKKTRGPGTAVAAASSTRPQRIVKSKSGPVVAPPPKVKRRNRGWVVLDEDGKDTGEYRIVVLGWRTSAPGVADCWRVQGGTGEQEGEADGFFRICTAQDTKAKRLVKPTGAGFIAMARLRFWNVQRAAVEAWMVEPLARTMMRGNKRDFNCMSKEVGRGGLETTGGKKMCLSFASAVDLGLGSIVPGGQQIPPSAPRVDIAKTLDKHCGSGILDSAKVIVDTGTPQAEDVNSINSEKPSRKSMQARKILRRMNSREEAALEI